jgi:CRP-like cAMP-binding protein
MEIKHLLKRCYLCTELDESELSALADICVTRPLKRKEILFFQGDQARGFYILLQGKVRIYKASPDGKEYTLHQIESGQMFAEAAIFRGHGYPANCEAVKDSLVALLPKESFVNLAQNSPNLTIKMLGGLSAFLREFTEMVESLSLKEVPARLAYFLISEHQRTRQETIRLSVSKTELASKLGTVSETLSRNFRKLIDVGAISVNGRAITLLDIPRLEAIAAGEKI